MKLTTLLLATAVATLTACGGGGGGGTPTASGPGTTEVTTPTPTPEVVANSFNLDAAVKSYIGTSSTATAKVSGTINGAITTTATFSIEPFTIPVTGTATSSASGLVTSTFQSKAAMANTVTDTASVTGTYKGTSFTLPTSTVVTYYVDTANVPLGYSTTGESAVVTKVSTPKFTTGAKVGDTFQWYTADVFTEAVAFGGGPVQKTLAATLTTEVSVIADPAVVDGTGALLMIKSTRTDVVKKTQATASATYKVSNAGVIKRVSQSSYASGSTSQNGVGISVAGTLQYVY